MKIDGFAELLLNLMTHADDDELEERNLKFSMQPKLGFVELLLNLKIRVGVGGSATEEEKEEDQYFSNFIAARGTRARWLPLGVAVSDGKTETSRSVTACSQNPAGGRSHVSKKAPRHLITVGTSHGRWQGKWSCDYLLSLRDLRLGDLVEEEVEDEQKKKKNDATAVLVNLSIDKHASFGLSIDGRIVTAFTRKCSHCSSPYCRQVDASFNVWVLPSSRSDNSAVQLPEIGGDDPSVIYVKPGGEAHLDSLIQDTLRLTVSAKDTCSETCARSEPTLQCELLLSINYYTKQNKNAKF
ncbi:hypothetical protein CDL15_Pgr009598 [Punica granatum]|uniref:Large ribosomal RNA subunit accumulation protein YCED homolog 2, chloroplastic n=1 Tax=Punica granatum TaxID=22663 RepID=A0A218WTH9_PUNGR|nr:hypothetical protein CDL15_Pgr009598 [Punica granatum]